MQNLTLVQLDALQSEFEVILEYTQQHDSNAHIRIRVDALQRLLFMAGQHIRQQRILLDVSNNDRAFSRVNPSGE